MFSKLLLTMIVVFVGACGIKGPPLPPLEDKPKVQAPPPPVAVVASQDMTPAKKTKAKKKNK